MAARDPVLESLEAWKSEGLIDEALHERLRERAEADAGERRRRQASRFVTGTGAILLVAAFVVLSTMFWGDMTPVIRAVFLWGVTALVVTVGVLRMAGTPTDRLGTALVAAGMPLSLGAFVLTREWRPDALADPFVVLAAVLSAALIVAFAAWYARRNPVLPTVGLGMAFLYVPVVASAFQASSEAVILGLSIAAFTVLVGTTTMFVARPKDDFGLAPYALDGLFWVAFVAAFPLVPTLWFDVLAPFDGLDNWGPILTFAALAAGAVVLGVRTPRNGILILGSIMAVADAWYFGISKGEAIGTFLALLASALVLFWLGHRLGFVGRARRRVPPSA